MKRTYPEQVGAFVDRIMKEYKIDGLLDRHQACVEWDNVVGEGIARYTSRRYMEGMKLHVFISSAPLKNELSFQRASIVKAINSRIGRTIVEEIIIH